MIGASRAVSRSCKSYQDMLVRGSVGKRQMFHMYSKVMNETVPATKAPLAVVDGALNGAGKASKKKRHPVRNFVLQFLLATGIFYGAGTYFALKNDQFNDYFCEYVPLGDEIVLTIEDNKGLFGEADLADLRKKIASLKDKTVAIPQKGAFSENINEAYEKIKAKSDELYKKDKASAPAVAEKPKETLIPVATDKIVEKLELPVITYKSRNPDVNSVVERVNTLIASINDNTAVPTTPAAFNKLIANITQSIETIADKVKAFDTTKEDLATEISQKLTAEHAVELKKKENEVVEKFLADFNREVTNIRTNYEKTLQHDVDLTRQAYEIKFDNRLKLAQIEQLKSFEKDLSDKIEAQRDGKLKNLNELYKKVELLEKFEVELYNNFEKFSQYNELNSVLNNLKKIVFHSETYQNNLNELNGPQIIEQINKLAQLTGSNTQDKEKINNNLLALTILALPTDSIQSKGLLSNAQLVQRWNLLAPELRSASLLPPNAGLLGHLSAKFFSFFLIPKQGNVPAPGTFSTTSAEKPIIDAQLIGNDIESVIARVSYKLSNGDLDDAIEIVSGLKGWSRKLSNDWLVEARKKLEVEFLIDLLETEIKYSY